MNKNPDMSGIERYWRKGEDDRLLVQGACRLDRGTVDAVLAALQKVVFSRPRTKLVGFGVFTWRPWRNRIPTGEVVETWRLSFKPGRYTKKYKGGKKCRK